MPFPFQWLALVATKRPAPLRARCSVQESRPSRGPVRAPLGKRDMRDMQEHGGQWELLTFVLPQAPWEGHPTLTMKKVYEPTWCQHGHFQGYKAAAVQSSSRCIGGNGSQAMAFCLRVTMPWASCVCPRLAQIHVAGLPYHVKLWQLQRWLRGSPGLLDINLRPAATRDRSWAIVTVGHPENPEMAWAVLRKIKGRAPFVKSPLSAPRARAVSHRDRC